MKRTNIFAPFGQAAETIENHFHSDRARYRVMEHAALLEEREKVAAVCRATRSAFFRHPTVWWYLAVSVVLVAGLLFTWRTADFLFVSAWAILVVVPVTFWMVHSRRSIFGGLKDWRGQLDMIDECLAVKAAVATYGDRKQ